MRVRAMSMWMRWCAVAVGFSFGVQALSAQGPLPQPRISDSAGVRIIEYPTLGPMPPIWSKQSGNPFYQGLHALPPAFRMEARPYIDIGGLRDSEDEELSTAQPFLTATELSNGTIVVNDMYRLKFFTRNGHFIRGAGRRGDGPAEFGTQTRDVCLLRGDTIMVFDFLGRITLWNGEGKPLRKYARPGAVVASSCTANGLLIIRKTETHVAKDAADFDLVDPLHRTWIEDFTALREWTVLDSTGVLLGRFTVPGSGPITQATLANVTADHVVLRQLDGEGAVHLRFYRLLPI